MVTSFQSELITRLKLLENFENIQKHILTMMLEEGSSILYDGGSTNSTWILVVEANGRLGFWWLKRMEDLDSGG